jgi:hypothetical protein
MARVTLQGVRLAFPNLFEAKLPQGSQGGKAKFSAAAIFAKDSPNKDALLKAINEVATAKWGAKAGDVLLALKASDKLCLHDGDAKADTPGYKGNLFVNASNEIRPTTLAGGPDGRAPTTAADGKLYAGAKVNMMVEVWAQDNQFGKRVNASLLGVQFVADGERLSGGGVASADDFEAIPQAATEKAAAAGTGAAALF